MRIARRSIGAAMVLAIVFLWIRQSVENQSLYGSPVSVVDVLVALAVSSPFIVLAFTPTGRLSRTQERNALVALLASSVVFAAAWRFAETSLDSTAGLAVFYASMLGWVCVGIVSWLRSRNERQGTSST